MLGQRVRVGSSINVWPDEERSEAFERRVKGGRTQTTHKNCERTGGERTSCSTVTSDEKCERPAPRDRVESRRVGLVGQTRESDRTEFRRGDKCAKGKVDDH